MRSWFIAILGLSPELGQLVGEFRERLEQVGDETIVPVKPFGASADSSGITFWGGKAPSQFGTLPWSRVTSIQADRVATGNTWRPAILISYIADGGSLHAVELLGANADRAQIRTEK